MDLYVLPTLTSKQSPSFFHSYHTGRQAPSIQKYQTTRSAAEAHKHTQDEQQQQQQQQQQATKADVVVISVFVDMDVDLLSMLCVVILCWNICGMAFAK
jgi:hypothetical protein